MSLEEFSRFVTLKGQKPKKWKPVSAFKGGKLPRRPSFDEWKKATSSYTDPTKELTDHLNGIRLRRRAKPPSTSSEGAQSQKAKADTGLHRTAHAAEDPDSQTPPPAEPVTVHDPADQTAHASPVGSNALDAAPVGVVTTLKRSTGGRSESSKQVLAH